MTSTAVPQDRWQEAQEWELAYWRRAQHHPGWKGVAYPILKPILGLFESRKVLGDDANYWWAAHLDRYTFLPKEPGAMIELGCGAYTNMRLAIRDRKPSSVVCSDPLADS